MKKIVFIFMFLTISGCAPYYKAEPKLVSGNYYMAGDANCINGRLTNDSKLYCIDANGVFSGYRNPMSTQEIQMYIYQEQRKKQNLKELGESFRNLGNSVGGYNSGYTPSNQMYIPETYVPSVGGSNKVKNCYRAGAIIHCR